MTGSVIPTVYYYMIRSAFSPIYPYITNDSHVRIIASFHQVFRPTLPFTGIVHHRSGPTVCTSVSLRVSIRVSPPTLPLHWNNSPPIGVQHMCSCPSLAQPRQVHFRGNQLSFPVLSLIKPQAPLLVVPFHQSL